jgi:hypothetical protein
VDLYENDQPNEKMVCIPSGKAAREVSFVCSIVAVFQEGSNYGKIIDSPFRQSVCLQQKQVLLSRLNNAQDMNVLFLH